MPKLSPLQVAGPVQGRFNPNIPKSAFGDVSGTMAAAETTMKLGSILENMQIEKDTNAGKQAGLDAQVAATEQIAKLPKNGDYYKNVKDILEKTKSAATKGMTSKYSEDAFNSKWDTFNASRQMQAVGIEAQAVDAEKRQVFKNEIETTNKALIADPTDLTMMSQGMKSYDEEMKRQGYSPDDKIYQQGFKRLEADMQAARISGFTLQGNVERAKEELEIQKKNLDPLVYNELKEGIHNKELNQMSELGAADARQIAFTNYTDDNDKPLTTSQNATKRQEELQKLKDEVWNDDSITDYNDKKRIVSDIEGAYAQAKKYKEAQDTNRFMEKRERYLRGDSNALNGLTSAQVAALKAEKVKLEKARLPDDGSDESIWAEALIDSWLHSPEYLQAEDKMTAFTNYRNKYSMSPEAMERTSKTASKLAMSQPVTNQEPKAKKLWEGLSNISEDLNEQTYYEFVGHYTRNKVYEMSQDEQKTWASNWIIGANQAPETFDVLGANITNRTTTDIIENAESIDFDDSSINLNNLGTNEEGMPITLDEVQERAAKIAKMKNVPVNLSSNFVLTAALLDLRGTPAPLIEVYLRNAANPKESKAVKARRQARETRLKLQKLRSN